MNGRLGIQRIYSLGNYKNLQVTDVIEDIPEEYMLNEDFVNNLRMMQLLRSDKVYYDYVRTSPSFVDGITSEESIEAIEQASISTMEKLMKTVASNKSEKEIE